MVAQFRDRETDHGQSRDGPNPENAWNNTASWVSQGSGVRVSASYSTVSHLNAHPQCLGPTLKLLFMFTCYFGCCLMCVLLSPSGEGESMCVWEPLVYSRAGTTSVYPRAGTLNVPGRGHAVTSCYILTVLNNRNVDWSVRCH